MRKSKFSEQKIIAILKAVDHEDDTKSLLLVDSPWFAANSITEYSAYVGVSVDVTGDVDEKNTAQYGKAFGSIWGTLSYIKIQQCLV